ncbi:TonB-dependent receptor [Verrucomicrobiaceae bacterium R5-34]|uniref:TonB-dependent receptor n=1 Tax=Oceaniferula flava TaxID=2800421 RepID=A0AAE2SEX2_9BACT|nr:TonB-dependent receptor [Oceaniferula flavus]MBK1831792.1 TonB-dependent receptor [Verrucomicrobiaceae bacterium R5-34]MBK1856117.1 TonB-dependent receptor [Oceaniferula flavus]MBM1137424.1 TonB-dependent receptor [Oceaniferula flavus]
MSDYQGRDTPSTYDKALRINLDAEKYGTFAEIGAGQEVGNWFFRVSASAGTVAKTISAYDMTMSDAIYGKAKRYVSRQRVASMLKYEYDLLVERLSAGRGDNTTFFSFCNTVRARGYQDTGECHGWLGIRLQLRPNTDACQILIHVRLLDDENVDQMEALGIIGVNLLYAAFYYRENLVNFTESLMDGLTKERVEVDMLKFSGKGFEMIDNRLCHLQLVRSGLTDAAMFLPDGEVVPPAEALYRKPLILLRGSFEPVTNLHMDMLKQTREVFQQNLPEDQRDATIELCEISMNNLLREGEVDHLAFIDRADALQALGKTVLISRCPEFHRIASYLSRYTTSPIGIVLSIGLLNELFKEKWSENLAGGILESFGRLFKNELSLYVYPWKNRKTKDLVTAENFQTPENLSHLYTYFREQGLIHPIPCGEDRLLDFTGRDIQRMIAEGDETWKSLVPEQARLAALHR